MKIFALLTVNYLLKYQINSTIHVVHSFSVEIHNRHIIFQICQSLTVTILQQLRTDLSFILDKLKTLLSSPKKNVNRNEVISRIKTVSNLNKG